jgi:hypothetical protein
MSTSSLTEAIVSLLINFWCYSEQAEPCDRAKGTVSMKPSSPSHPVSLTETEAKEEYMLCVLYFFFCAWGFRS